MTLIWRINVLDTVMVSFDERPSSSRSNRRTRTKRRRVWKKLDASARLRRLSCKRPRYVNLSLAKDARANK